MSGINPVGQTAPRVGTAVIPSVSYPRVVAHRRSARVAIGTVGARFIDTIHLGAFDLFSGRDLQLQPLVKRTVWFGEANWERL